MDRLSPETRSRNMSAIRGIDTKPEMLVRRLLHAMGYRYRLHRKDLPGRPDVAFGRRRKAIYVHGCFWHQHDDPACKIAHAPKSRLDYWEPKLSRNRARDAASLAAMAEAGWDVLVVWECETKDIDALREKLRAFMESDGRPLPASCG